MKIALVYDRVNKLGGAEQVLLALHEIWPDAPLFTAVYNKDTAQWADVFKVIPSFIQYLPFAKRHHELYPWLTPVAFETFSFKGYDAVISITSAEAKNIITTPDTIHHCYCLTPTRYLWSGAETYQREPGLGFMSTLSSYILPKILPTLRRWDLYASTRPDSYIAISQVVKDRIETYYHRPVDAIIYPPVDVDFFTPVEKPVKNDAPFLIVSRFVPYKRIDLIIEACTALDLPLIVVGRGKDEQRLRKLAGPQVIFRTDLVSNFELRDLYRQCRAFLYAGEEDFGIVAAEAQSCGKSVLCYANSGLRDIIVPGKTGAFFENQNLTALISALKQFNPEQYSVEDCRSNALRFSKSEFQKNIKQFVEEFRNIYYS